MLQGEFLLNSSQVWPLTSTVLFYRHLFPPYRRSWPSIFICLSELNGEGAHSWGNTLNYCIRLSGTNSNKVITLKSKGENKISEYTSDLRALGQNPMYYIFPWIIITRMQVNSFYLPCQNFGEGEEYRNNLFWGRISSWIEYALCEEKMQNLTLCIFSSRIFAAWVGAKRRLQHLN